MDRYVDADELRAGVDATNWYHIRDGRLVSGARSDLDPLYKAADIVELVESLEPADVAPVVHAHWIIIYESSAGVTDAKCSNCGYESLAYENDVHTDENCNYCPGCGAKMDEEVPE